MQWFAQIAYFCRYIFISYFSFFFPTNRTGNCYGLAFFGATKWTIWITANKIFQHLRNFWKNKFDGTKECAICLTHETFRRSVVINGNDFAPNVYNFNIKLSSIKRWSRNRLCIVFLMHFWELYLVVAKSARPIVVARGHNPFPNYVQAIERNWMFFKLLKNTREYFCRAILYSNRETW